MRLAALLLLALPLAGCLGGFRDIAVQEVPAPGWGIGEAWNYSILDGVGRALGWVRFQVTAVEPVANETDRAYAVRMDRFDVGDVDHNGVPDETWNRTLHFDARTRNIIYNDCGKPGLFGACHGRDPQLDFPLFDGKMWSSTSGGDVLVEYTNKAVRVNDTAWRITRAVKGEAQPFATDLYDERVSFYRERERAGGSQYPPPVEPERWLLREHTGMAGLQ